jgi:hypothetical protein
VIAKVWREVQDDLNRHKTITAVLQAYRESPTFQQTQDGVPELAVS